MHFLNWWALVCVHSTFLFWTDTFDRTDVLIDAGRTVSVTVTHSLCRHTLISRTLQLSDGTHTPSLITVVSTVIVTITAVEEQNAPARWTAELILSAQHATVCNNTQHYHHDRISQELLQWLFIMWTMTERILL